MTIHRPASRKPPWRWLKAAIFTAATAAIALAAVPAFAASAAATSPAPSGGGSMPAAWVWKALLHGEDLAPLSGSGSAPSAAAPAVTRTVVVGGMPGWQIALIVIGTALVAAAAAVLLDRTWAARRRPDTTIPPATSRPGQPDEDPKFRAAFLRDDADLIGTADLAVPRTRPTPR